MSRIMAVDDDNSILTVLKDVLEKESYNVSAWDNPMDALEEAKKEDYDIFLVDLKLPDISGIKLIEMLKDTHKTSRYIVITGYGDVNTVIKAFKAGASDLLLKPFTKEEILSSIRKQIVEKDRVDSQLSILGNTLKDSKIGDFARMLQGLNLNFIDDVDGNINSLKELGEKYALITKKNIQTLKKFSKRAKKDKKLAADMISYLSHEMRSPLNAIIGFTRTLMTQCDLGKTEFMKEFLSNILESSLYMLDLTQSILTSSALDSNKVKLELEKFSIQKILKNVHSSLMPRISAKGLEYKEEIEQGVDIIVADKLKLTQILHNLLDNAIKYTNAGSVSIDIRNTLNKKEAIFTVKDTGIGISYKDKATLFKKFERLDMKNFDGAGLGLSISKNLVELHGGKIWVESRLNHGSAFSFTIPYISWN